MEWLRSQGKYMKLVTSNPRTIKLWKMYEKTEKKVVKGAGKDLTMPKLQVVESGTVAELQKAFPTKHNSSINSISVTKNEEYLMSSDDGQIFMWSL